MYVNVRMLLPFSMQEFVLRLQYCYCIFWNTKIASWCMSMHTTWGALKLSCDHEICHALDIKVLEVIGSKGCNCSLIADTSLTETLSLLSSFK